MCRRPQRSKGTDTRVTDTRLFRAGDAAGQCGDVGDVGAVREGQVDDRDGEALALVAHAQDLAVAHVPDGAVDVPQRGDAQPDRLDDAARLRSEEPTSALQSLMRTSYAVFSFKKKTNRRKRHL